MLMFICFSAHDFIFAVCFCFWGFFWVFFNLFNCFGVDDDDADFSANVTHHLGHLGTASSLYVEYSGLEEQMV